MQFFKLAAIIGTLSALASATPTPDLPVAELPAAEPEKPAVRFCRDANYPDCMERRVIGTYCLNLFDPFDNSVSSIRVLSPSLGTCTFYKDDNCKRAFIESSYDLPIEDSVFDGSNDQISSFKCDNVQ